MKPSEYNTKELAADRLTMDHVSMAITQFQLANDLEPDGKAGAATRAALERLSAPMDLEAQLRAVKRVWPLRCLPNGRKPQITSGHYSRNPSRSTHRGVDMFFRHLEGDPKDVHRGDGAGAGTDPDGTVKWWIPSGTQAIASASGKVVLAGDSPTGFRVWIDVGPCLDGYFHCSKLLVTVGEFVEQGHPIGIVGDNPREIDASHLHLENYVGDLDRYRFNVEGSLDPEIYLETATYLVAA